MAGAAVRSLGPLPLPGPPLPLAPPSLPASDRRPTRWRRPSARPRSSRGGRQASHHAGQWG
eukprot:5752299-Alexandrium_andersonii.AAC.1